MIRCDVCLVEVRRAHVQRCRICGATLCTDHNLAGLCPDHFHTLVESKQTSLLRHFSIWKSMKRRVYFGLIPIIILAILLVNSTWVYYNTFHYEQWFPIGSFYLFLGPLFFLLVWLSLRWAKKATISKNFYLKIIRTIELLQDAGPPEDERNVTEESEDNPPSDSNSHQTSGELDESK